MFINGSANAILPEWIVGGGKLANQQQGGKASADEDVLCTAVFVTIIVVAIQGFHFIYKENCETPIKEYCRAGVSRLLSNPLQSQCLDGLP